MRSLSFYKSVLVTIPLIIAYTIVMGSLSMLGSVIDSRGRLQHACSRIWSKLILWTSGVRLTVAGTEKVRAGTPYVFCVNHQSYMDIAILLASLSFQFRFAAKKELFRIPFLGWHLRRCGHVTIDRENPHAAIKSLQGAADAIRSGIPVVIFPEGRTSRDGSMRPFKSGGFMLAARAGAEVVPITIRGARAILQPDTYHIRGGPVHVLVGQPLSPNRPSPDELAKRVRDHIAANLNQELAMSASPTVRGEIRFSRAHASGYRARYFDTPFGDT